MITKGQALSEHEFHEQVTRADGTCYVWRRNGQTQTWVTRPDNFRVPVKYGLREYGNITELNAANHYPGSDCPNCKQLAEVQERKAREKRVH